MDIYLEIIDPYIHHTFWGNTVQDYLIALGIFVGTLVLLRIFQRVLLHRLSVWTERTTTTIDDRLIGILKGISRLFFYFLALYVSLKYSLQVQDQLVKILDGIFVVLAVYEIIKILQQLFFFVLERALRKQDPTTLHAFGLVIKVVLWSIGILLILSNLGFNVSTLAASLGVGGIAVALAAQNILGDLFAAFSLYFDRPFQIGDFVVLGTDKGTVKKIGLKSTRIETLQGEELVVSNQELISTRVQNYKKMKKRRISFSVGVTYGTPPKKLEKINSLIQKIIEKEELAEFDRSHFHTFGDFSLNFDIVYYVTTSDYVDYLNTQQAINFGIVKAFEKEKIEIAFPTQTVYLGKA